MVCRDLVGRARRRCVDWEAQQRRACRDWRTRWRRRCDDWEEQQERRCDRWRTESEQVCDRWEEERHKECDGWIIIFRWLCIAWAWVTTLVCKAWSWVTSTFCDLWTWVTTLICRAWVWVGTVFCALWVIITTWICRLWVLILDFWCVFACFVKRLLAPNEFSEDESECIYGWTSAYRADFDPRKCTLTITLRLRLVPASGVSAADIATVQARWEPAIERAWSGQFPLVLTEGSCSCEAVTLQVDVQWVNSGEHHAVNVLPGSGRADMLNWYVNSTGGTAAHEAGHMFGNVDEYADSNCPNRTVTSDGSIMQTSQNGSVLVRHLESFQRWLSNRTCCTYQAQ